jgi:type 1 glutamine amidotransferase
MNHAARLFTCLLFTAALLLSPPARAEGKKKILLIAGTPSHEWGGHEHNAGVLLLAKCLKESQLADQLDVVTFNSKKGDNGKFTLTWPTPADFENAAAIVIYADGGNGHPALAHLQELDDLAKKGVGIGMIHYAVEPGDEKNPNNGREQFLKWIGGYFETYRSINPHWKASFTDLPKHPVTNGVHPLATHDEWYYHMRFRDNMEGVTPIFSAVPPDSTRQGKDDAHGGNPHVREGIGKNLPETVVWVSQNKNGSRGFGCSGAHYHWNWAQDDFRKGVLNAIVWIARGDVPAHGVESSRPTMDELMANQDEKVPANFDKAKVEKQIEEMNKPQATAKADNK